MMCGIIACTGTTDAAGDLITGLKNLEYRGYDSAGIAVHDGCELRVRKREGRITALQREIAGNISKSVTGIGHTRWSTHGPPSDDNAHPHTGERGTVAVVHNGIIENYEALRNELEARGRTFTSETDTEVIPHLVERGLDDGLDAEPAFRRAVGRLEGSYAVAMLVEGRDEVFATRQDSPLVLGIGEQSYYLASDVPAFLEFTDRVTYLQDGDFVVASPDGVTITDVEGGQVTRDTEVVDWNPEETSKGAYDHFMLKEIDSQPDALSKTIGGRLGNGGSGIELDDISRDAYEDISDIHLVGCGTSYHAAMCGARLCDRYGIPAHAYRASEYDANVADTTTLLVAVTQSGETADTLSAVREGTAGGAGTLAVTNVIGSTAAREADDALYIRAGPEIGVAATKTFSSQFVTLSMLVEHLAENIEGVKSRSDIGRFSEALEALPRCVDEVLQSSRAKGMARRYRNRSEYFFIGSGLEHPVALEGALKFKEITYEHAEGFAAGELKHGPLALVTPETTLIALVTGHDAERTRTNAREAAARGADIVAVAPDGLDVSGFADDVLRVPKTHPGLECLLTNVQLQLVSYHMADLLDRSIDKPRNLAKSVTVQ